MTEAWNTLLAPALLLLWQATWIAIACSGANRAGGNRWQRILGAAAGGVIVAPLIGVFIAGTENGLAVGTIAVYLAMLIGAASPKGRLLGFKSDAP